jgi:AcrR family transcriptional regulator
MAFSSQTSTALHRRRGPQRFPRGQVTEIQRSRMLTAAVEVVDEVGYARLTVAQVISRARVSRKTFYDVFADREDCYMAAFDRALDEARALAKEAYGQHPQWRDGVRAALCRLLRMMDEEPSLAKLCVVEALAAGPRVLERRARLLDEVADVIDRGRFLAGAPGEPPAVTAEGVAGAIFAVLHARVLEGGVEPLTSLLGPLMSMIVLPYLGPNAASAELARPPVESHSDGRSPARRVKDPLEGLNMRLTYRTVRVLAVIAEHPGASNREIADGSGIVDQGQISKLLARLARLALVENLGDGQERGGSNAWHLTARGKQVERATRPR